MKKQIVKLFFFLTLMMVSVVGKGQNWTWGFETHSIGQKYYMYNVGEKKFLNDDNKLTDAPNCIWTVNSDNIVSGSNKYISVISSGFSRYTITAVSNASSGTLSAIENKETYYQIGNKVQTSLTNNQTRFIVSDNSTLGASSNNNVSDNLYGQWYFISPAQMNNYNRYIEVYKAAQTAGVDVTSYSSANNTNAATVITNIENAIKAKFSSATIDNRIDATGLIKNAGYEFNTWNYGWTSENFEEHTNEGKFVDSHIAQKWSPEIVSGSVKQTVNLPQGVYVLKAKISAGFDGTEQYMYAKTTTETRKTYVSGKDGDPAEYHEVMFRVLPEDNGQAEIGFSRENIRWWTAVDDWSLEYLGVTPAFTYEMGTRLDGTHLSKPAYTSTPADGVDPDHADDALLVVTWPNENTNDPWSEFKIADGAKATVTADGVNTKVDLLSHFRSSTYHNGFGLYIPGFDEKKTYTIIIPAGSIGFATANGNAYANEYANVMNEEFTINAKQSPIKDGKYFIRVAGTSKHVSRGGHFGTQAILDNYGVPVLVQTAGLTVFKFLDNNAFFGNDLGADDMYTDCFDDRTRRYNLIPDNEEKPTKVQFFTPARNKYLYHANDAINGVPYEKISEGDQGEWYDFEPFTAEGYQAHLLGIEDAEAQRVAERAGYKVNSYEEYNRLIADLEKKGAETVWPVGADQETLAATYHEARNNDLPVEPAWEATPKDLIGGGERITLKLNKGLYVVSLNAFQQASALEGLQKNLGFRGLVYYYAKVGNVMYKSQLKSITENITGSIPTTEEEAMAALADKNYLSQIIFYVPADGTNVEFGVQNPQRLGNGIDGNAGSWVAFQNLKIETFGDVVEANMKITAGKYGTFIAPFAVKLPAGVTAYSGELNSEKTSVALTSEAEEGTELAACTPVIVKNDGDTDVDMTYREVDVRTDKTTVSEKSGVLVGFYVAGENVPNGSYVLQDQGQGQKFYKVSTEAITGVKNRCYVDAETSGVKVLNFEFADEETAIESLANGATIVEYYSVNGTKLSAPQKGINLVKMSDSTVKKIFVK